MKRREFLTATCLAGIAPLSQITLAQQKKPDKVKRAGGRKPESRREYYELKQYHIETEEQKKRFDGFMRDAAIPAMNRLGIEPVGVFYMIEGLSPVYVLLRHKTPKSILTLNTRLLKDEEFLRKGSDFLDTSSSEPAYKRVCSSLMVAFHGMPRLEVPTKKAERIFQLRTYESHSMKAGRKKIEMFNKGEINIFRKTGLHPVFFGETLVGSELPNLTYMLGFDNMEESKANWSKFINDPDWKKLRAIPEYADEKIISHITNIYLRPAVYSQI